MSPVVILLLLVVVVVPAQCDQCVTVEGLPNGQVGAHCVFPFIHKNVTYVGCKKLVKKPGEGWCSTKVDSDGQHIKGNWGAVWTRLWFWLRWREEMCREGFLPSLSQVRRIFALSITCGKGISTLYHRWEGYLSSLVSQTRRIFCPLYHRWEWYLYPLSHVRRILILSRLHQERKRWLIYS